MKPIFELPVLLSLNGDVFSNVAPGDGTGSNCSGGCKDGCCSGCDAGSGSGYPS